MKHIIDMMLLIEPAAMKNQVPVWIPELRKISGMPTEQFNIEVLKMSKTGIAFLQHHFHPAQLSDTQRREMIVLDNGQVVCSIGLRADECQKFLEMTNDPEDTIHGDKPTMKKTGRGGRRDGAGRPWKKIKFQKLPMPVRLSGWVVEWLKEQDGKPAEMIEQALIEKYGLTPPEDD